MMIAIVILGLGLVMVATMFPVAWTRARTLSETTVERSIAAGAEARLSQSLQPCTLRQANYDDGAGGRITITEMSNGGLIGDFVYTSFYNSASGFFEELVLAESDTQVHALNMSNLKAADLEEVQEDPWQLERVTQYFKPFPPIQDLYTQLGSKSPFASRVPFTQRVYPQLPPKPPDSEQEAAAQWRDQLDQRRFAMAILHRLQNRIGPNDPDPNPITPEIRQQAQAAMAKPRTFDMYYVTLRRPNPTNRYARQDPASAPDRDYLNLQSPGPVPAALNPVGNDDPDVLFPAAWRVNVDFYAAPTVFKTPTATTQGPTGVPTEIRVPQGGANNDQISHQFFPQGTRFIDEVSGSVYRVAGRRVAFEGAREVAYLTLDREVFIEDLDYMSSALSFGSDGNIQPEEQVRTVWVFPPAVDRSTNPPNFTGPSPVVSIDVRTMTLSPPS